MTRVISISWGHRVAQVSHAAQSQMVQLDSPHELIGGEIEIIGYGAARGAFLALVAEVDVFTADLANFLGQRSLSDSLAFPLMSRNSRFHGPTSPMPDSAFAGIPPSPCPHNKSTIGNILIVSLVLL
jgi:hypothetical protein